LNRIIKICSALLLITCMVLSISLPVCAQDNSVTIVTGFNFDGSNGGQKIPIGSTIQHFGDGTTKVFNSDNSLILTTSDSDSKLVATPDGYKSADRVYYVPSETIVNHIGNIVKCYNNNQLILTVIDTTSDSVTNNGPIPQTVIYGIPVENAKQYISPDYFNAQWICPSSPPQSDPNITNFLWNGIEDANAQYVIQPVLQWNQFVGGGAGCWTGSAWYVYPGGYICTCCYIPVVPGDSCQGTVNYNPAFGTWTVMFYDNSHSTAVGLIIYTNIQVSPSVSNLAILELETADLSGVQETNGNMPGTTTFTNIILTKNGQNDNGNWNTMVWSPWYYVLWNLTNLQVTTVGNTSVTMHTANP
jgi:hypothetical protein